MHCDGSPQAARETILRDWQAGQKGRTGKLRFLRRTRRLGMAESGHAPWQLRRAFGMPLYRHRHT